MENKEFKKYFYKKFIESILYNHLTYFEFLNGKYDNYMSDYNFINLLAKYADNCIKNNRLESLQRGRLYTILLKIRNSVYCEKKEIKDQYIELYNNLIDGLNNCRDIDRFDDIEIKRRTNYNLRFCTKSKKEKIKSFVKDSIGFDFVVLNYLISSDDFENNIIKSKYFWISLNVILDEFPSLLNNANFVSKIKMIILKYQIEKLHDSKIKKILKKL